MIDCPRPCPQDSHWEKPSAPVSAEQEEIMARVLEEDMLKMIVVSLLDHKPSLYYYYTQVDTGRTGLIAPDDWASGLRTVLQLDLPFLPLQPRLAEADPVTGLISYPKFLDRYRVEMLSPDGSSGVWQEAVIDAICEKLFLALQRLPAQQQGEGAAAAETAAAVSAVSPRVPSSVKDAFSLFDADNDGRIEYEEFISLLKTMDVGLSEAQVYELMRGMDKNKDSVIDLEEFTSRFGIIFTGYVDRDNVRLFVCLWCGGLGGMSCQCHSSLVTHLPVVVTTQEDTIEGLSAADSKMLMVRYVLCFAFYMHHTTPHHTHACRFPSPCTPHTKSPENRGAHRQDARRGGREAAGGRLCRNLHGRGGRRGGRRNLLRAVQGLCPQARPRPAQDDRRAGGWVNVWVRLSLYACTI